MVPITRLASVFSAILLVAAAIAPAASGQTVAPIKAAAISTAANPAYGVLIANPTYQSPDFHAGVRLAVISLSWSQWEPTAGSFSPSYLAQEAKIVAGYRNAGFTVGVNLGLNYAPAWVMAMPAAHLVDQRGALSATANFEFNDGVRKAANVYINGVVNVLGPVSYYTIGTSDRSEALYPTTSSGQWWAFDANAQGKANGLTTGQVPTPLPGWVPGASTYQGQTLTTAQVQGWYDWYQNGLISSLAWEMRTLRSAGFTGSFQLQLVGDGANPWVYSHRVAAYLAPQTYDAYSTLNAGAVYQAMLSRLPDLTGLVVDVTSVGDMSGSPADNSCLSSDSGVSMSDAQVNKWSSIRWLTYLAGQHGLPVIGESTGQNSAAQMTHDIALMTACGLIGLQWAFDAQLYDGVHASIADYASRIGTATSPVISMPVTSHQYSTRSANTTSSPASFTVTNSGTAPLTISAVTERGAGFAISTNTCTAHPIAASASCTIAATFTPPADTSYTGTISLTHNASGSPRNITLTGSALG
jgi:hypothetical protein